VILNATARRCGAVLATEGLTPSIYVKVSGNLAARTNFQAIYVAFNAEGMSEYVAVACARGMVYHEGGHCRFTVPFPRLGLDSAFRGSWNILEDNRMEMAVVLDSPVKARYLTATFLNVVMSEKGDDLLAHCLATGRLYLPKKVRRAIRSKAAATYGDDVVDTLTKLVHDYMRATNNQQLRKAIVAFHNYYHSVGQRQTSTLSTPMFGGQNEATPVPGMDEAIENDEDSNAASSGSDQGAEPQDGEASSDGEASDDENAEGAGSKDSESENDEPQDGENAESDSKGGNGAGKGDSLQDVLDEANKDLDLDEDQTVADDIRAGEDTWQRITNPDGKHSALDYAVSNRAQDQSNIGTLDALAENIASVFRAAIVDREPSWVESQPRGILNVLRHETRSAGDINFWRQWADDDQPSHNIALSVLLDVSGSMDSHQGALAKAAYVTKRAGDMLGIPTTVIVWSSAAKVLWNYDEPATEVLTFPITGNTDPTDALYDVKNHRQDRERHIVLILTDGIWDSPIGSNDMIGRLVEQDAITIGFGFGNDTLATTLSKYGCKEAFSIGNLNELPRSLEWILPKYGL
jgi:hypothetical protein